MSGETRQLYGTLHRLGAAVRKEDAIEARELAQALGQLSLIFVVIEIRNVNKPGRLLADGLDDTRMSMAQGIHAQSGYEVEILLTFEVVEENAFAAFESNRIPVVGREEKTLFEIGDLIETGHGFIVKLTEVRSRAVSDLLSGFGVPRGFAGSNPAAVIMARPSSSAETANPSAGV